MVDYKCLWFGVKVKPERAKGTSSTCPRCGFKLKEYLNRQVECVNCGYYGDRDITACLNLLKASDVRVWFTLERPSNVAVNPALTSPMGNEDKLGEPKGGRYLPKSYQNPVYYYRVLIF